MDGQPRSITDPNYVLGDLLNLGPLVGAAQALAAALDGGYAVREVELECVQGLLGVVVGAEMQLTLAGARALDDLLSRALSLANELLPGDKIGLMFACFRGDPLGLALGFAQQFVALLNDPASFPDLPGDRRAHLLEDRASLVLLHTHVMAERDMLGASDERVQLVDQLEKVVHSRPRVGGARFGTRLSNAREVRTRTVRDRTAFAGRRTERYRASMWLHVSHHERLKSTPVIDAIGAVVAVASVVIGSYAGLFLIMAAAARRWDTAADCALFFVFIAVANALVDAARHWSQHHG
jgi:hypothetical protein